MNVVERGKGSETIDTYHYHCCDDDVQQRTVPSNVYNQNQPHQFKYPLIDFSNMPSHPVFRAGNSALITGAASGVGLAVAKLCHKNGMKLALVDRNSEALSAARSHFNPSNDTRTYSMDVGKIEEWSDLRAKVEMDFGQLSFLMLNAGIGLNSGWEDTEYFHKVTSICVKGRY